MKAHVKINISIHLESEASAAGTDAKAALLEKFPLQAQRAGVINVEDFAEGERTIIMLQNHIGQMFRNMGVKDPPLGHKPDLAAAFGGLPEPKQYPVCPKCHKVLEDCGCQGLQ